MTDPDDHPICGYPTTNRNGRPCQHRVAREGLRCHDHPRTPDEPPSAAESRPREAHADGGAPIGSWPGAEAVARVSEPVRTLSADGVGEDRHGE